MAHSLNIEAYGARLIPGAWTDYLLVSGLAIGVVLILLLVLAKLFGDDDGAGQ